VPISFSTDLPESIDLSGSSGNQSKLSRADHVHAHDNQPGGSLHDLTSFSGSGFVPSLSGTDNLSALTSVGNSSSWILTVGGSAPSGSISQGGRNLFGSVTIALSNSITFDEAQSGNSNIKVSRKPSRSSVVWRYGRQ
jgi:hypothetical protein